jgi:hypothetical protein
VVGVFVSVWLVWGWQLNFVKLGVPKFVWY